MAELSPSQNDLGRSQRLETDRLARLRQQEAAEEEAVEEQEAEEDEEDEGEDETAGEDESSEDMASEGGASPKNKEKKMTAADMRKLEDAGIKIQRRVSMWKAIVATEGIAAIGLLVPIILDKMLSDISISQAAAILKNKEMNPALPLNNEILSQLIKRFKKKIAYLLKAFIIAEWLIIAIVLLLIFILIVLIVIIVAFAFCLFNPFGCTSWGTIFSFI